MALGRANAHIRAVFVLALAAPAAIAFHLGSIRALLAGFDEDITAAIPDGAEVEIDPGKKTIRVLG